ncbi:uS14 family ribosomal protein [Candidatus Deianiraea vastatrix]|uniref:Small ribosomal subunit protein uS14 n=1 Tax=Candidatus Deianiraea vastatrix TaxID=2163644 RepID=A0A5B8XG30_9RICK|nr:30S ribosomal protein S14 [Candidatus Deianiraea vastatrix]QED23201.1 30S ribosomal protein S14 [Candidatus Deianiraea vastatrix]
MAKKSKIAKTVYWNAKIISAQKQRRLKSDMVKSGDIKSSIYLAKTKSYSVVRLKNRCLITGRPRGFIGSFGVSRNVLRDACSSCFLPGVIKN